MTLENALAITLRNRRIKCGLSQEDLAHECNVDRTYISMIERQKRNPTLNIIFRICKSLDIKASDFISGIEKAMENN
ncbi:helix-turn-helix domain-containing protein [Clostridium luticellarii]|jgi:transcriptional regulator with XRE-family HTH domain|uniref:Helix-turn-helix domain protein n=1 Tax=Clostridium luticellarii TaxID=1691940 RepID=A0A2T0BM10_9CLOT|nr:helix-turn-helix transcriptional regulator [Clostridium luticellarii]MCI1945488.1 helix-turn-helix transcriptional regulator [Clostridium luticellarii]MCI1968821.1 helix-turn-helix transcriptional regulator [Clostridium luticellarii]MCI1995841.1 helix-turn-helix transcriptional regulator [Clostridium luticellarii]MCI2040267.1 helix-turn-helix transcriptional regulator [Clostridium luticellarii]PRR84822.1 Helix-turn-helix domain protein [Clostridium luticellarii]